jgi:predicted XRE-type DNA-binding protein
MSNQIKATQSSGNVFADLGLKNPDERLAKAELAIRIAATIKARKLTQIAAAEVCGIDQPKISKLMRGDLYLLHRSAVPLLDRARPGRGDHRARSAAPARQYQGQADGAGRLTPETAPPPRPSQSISRAPLPGPAT